MSDLTFKMEHLDGYAIIEEECTVVVRVTYSVRYSKLYRKDGADRWLIPLRAVTESNLEALKEMDSVGELDYGDIGGMLMTGALWSNQIKDAEEMPRKGERIIATFAYRDNRLMCIGLDLIPRKEPKTFISAVYLSEMFKEFDDIIEEI